MPIEISFDPAFGKHELYYIFSIITDVIFMIDIFVQCLTSYVKKGTAREQKDFYSILWHYIFSVNFVYDFLALVGNTLIT